MTAFFLSKYLSRHYEIVNIVDVNAPEQILEQHDAIAVLSTFQRGFTNRLMCKGRQDIVQEIRKQMRGPLCSVYDFNYNDTAYTEDVIFTVRPPSERLTARIRRRSRNPNIRIVHMGWCAEPEFCSPDEIIPRDRVNIFIDHPPYNASARDRSARFYAAVRALRVSSQGHDLHVYQQGNAGIIEITDDTIADSTPYERSRKIPWPEMISWYRKMHVFCLATPQSACLSAIEASMCGAMLYVPKYHFTKPYLPRELLRREVAFQTFLPFQRTIAVALRRDIAYGFDRLGQHRRLLPEHTWETAADRIHRVLSRM